MVAGGQDVREQGEIPDLGHRLRLVGERQQVPVGERHHEIVGLTALPIPEIEAVGAAIDLVVDVHADVGVALLAVAAASAGDVEGDRAEIALLDEFDVAADLDDFTGHLVTHHHSGRRREAAVIDVLIAAADVRRHDLQDDAVLYLLAAGVGELRVLDRLDLELEGFDERHDAITVGHDTTPQVDLSSDRARKIRASAKSALSESSAIPCDRSCRA